MINNIRRTKIVITLGPSTDKEGILEDIIRSGADVLRLNFSHGVSQDHYRRADLALKIMKKLNRNISLLGDLQGPKIRINGFKKKKINLQVNDDFILDSNLDNNNGTEKKVGFSYKKLPKELSCNDILLLDDGKIQLKVIKIIDEQIFTKVIIGGELTNNKGINKLGGGLSTSILTEKDKNDIIVASNIGVDYLAVSFPRSPEDLKEARKLMRSTGSMAHIVAKIERAEAVKTKKIMFEIVQESDVIMIARGDLGVEIGDEQLIGVQKDLIKICHKLKKPVIVATQMMESMIYNSFPTRAEVSDVSNAVLDGTDAVMLSAETASGSFPVETVKKMSKICLGAEKILLSKKFSKNELNFDFHCISEAISISSMYAANHLIGTTAVIIISEFFKNIPLLSSRITSNIPIFLISKDFSKLRLCALYKGIVPIFLNIKNKNLSILDQVIEKFKKKGYLKKNDRVILIEENILKKNRPESICRILNVS